MAVEFEAVCRPKFMTFWDDVGDPSCFPAPLIDCLRHVSFRRYSPLSVEVVKKPSKCKIFLSPFLPVL